MSARSRTLHIGEAGGKRFTLPLDLASTTMAIVGVRGAGKTTTAVVVVEEAVAAGVPVVIIDPTDVWWGLKAARDGASEGLPVVVFCGAHGDLPLTADAGAAIAERTSVRNLGDVHAIWMGLLNGPQQKILQVLLEDYPDPVDRNELATRAGFQPGSGHVNNTIGSLTKLKAATVPVKGQVAASELLFPKGVR